MLVSKLRWKVERQTNDSARPRAAGLSRLTREQAAIIGAYTGISCGPFADIQRLADEKLNTVTFTHHFADPKLWERLKEAVRDDFLAVCFIEDPTDGL